MGHVFDPEALHRIAQTGVGRPPEEACRRVVEELVRTYPRYIDPGQEWIFNLSSGATGLMKVLHGSFTEYLILFGSAVGTEAFSGRYHLEIHDFVLTGEMWTNTRDAWSRRVVTKPGEWAVLPRGSVKGYRILEETWMLEYGRGIVPTSLPRGLGDAFLSAQDRIVIQQTLWAYGKLTLKNLLRGKI